MRQCLNKIRGVIAGNELQRIGDAVDEILLAYRCHAVVPIPDCKFENVPANSLAELLAQQF